MEWTKDKPTEPGYYWVKGMDSRAPMVVFVYLNTKWRKLNVDVLGGAVWPLDTIVEYYKYIEWIKLEIPEV